MSKILEKSKASGKRSFDVNYYIVRDRRGIRYVRKVAKNVPVTDSRHLVIYPDTSGVDPEDLPIQNSASSKLNGASPELLLVAVFNEMVQLPGSDETTLLHLDRAIKRLIVAGHLFVDS